MACDSRVNGILPGVQSYSVLSNKMELDLTRLVTRIMTTEIKLLCDVERDVHLLVDERLVLVTGPQTLAELIWASLTWKENTHDVPQQGLYYFEPPGHEFWRERPFKCI